MRDQKNIFLNSLPFSPQVVLPLHPFPASDHIPHSWDLYLVGTFGCDCIHKNVYFHNNGWILSKGAILGSVMCLVVALDSLHKPNPEDDVSRPRSGSRWFAAELSDDPQRANVHVGTSFKVMGWIKVKRRAPSSLRDVMVTKSPACHPCRGFVPNIIHFTDGTATVRKSIVERIDETLRNAFTTREGQSHVVGVQITL